MILSTGGLTEPDIHTLWHQLRDSSRKFQLLHCISHYPTPLADAQLGRIREWSLHGWSDHTGHQEMGGWAVLAGAQVVEVHIRRYDTPPSNPDYPHSIESRIYLPRYIQAIRRAEQVLGT